MLLPVSCVLRSSSKGAVPEGDGAPLQEHWGEEKEVPGFGKGLLGHQK